MFNKILIGIFAGNLIGGSQGLKYLDTALYAELITITQIHLAKWSTSPSVVHMLTCSTPAEEHPVMQLSSVNSRLIMNSKQTAEWGATEALMRYSINGLTISSTLKRIEDFIVKHHHHANTAPFVSALMDHPPLQQGSLLTYEPEIVQQCCGIILSQIGPRRPQIREE